MAALCAAFLAAALAGGCAQCEVDGDCGLTTQGCPDGTCVQGECSSRRPATGPACDDGNKCTSGDMCRFGVCVGSAISCDDPARPCALPLCDKEVGCTYKPGDDKLCDDGNKCTTNHCTEQGACTKVTALSATCYDGDLCNGPDTCDGAVCKAGKLTGAELCADERPCVSKACVPDSGCEKWSGATTCPASTEPCKLALCNKTGCELDSVPDGKVCPLGSPCVKAAQCKAGVCSATHMTCDDSKPCTADKCNEADGSCSHVDLPFSGTVNKAGDWEIGCGEDGAAPYFGGPWAPCKVNYDCDTGICIKVGKVGFCARSCVGKPCPKAFECRIHPLMDGAYCTWPGTEFLP